MAKPTNKSSLLLGSRRRPADEADRRPAAFSYHASRSAREANVGREIVREAEPTGSKHGRLWAVLLVIGLVLVVMSLFQGTSPAVELTGSADSQALLKPAQTYQMAAQQALHKNFWSWFKPAANQTAMTAALQQQFPELAVASLRIPLVGWRPTLVVAAHTPTLVLVGNGGTYVVDETGRALIASSQLAASLRAKLPLVTDNSGLTVAAGTDILPQDDVVFIEQVLAYLKAAKVNWQELTLPAAANELDVRIDGTAYYVKFALQGGASARQQVGSYIAVRDKLQGSAAPHEYIDVRVSERAYYK